MPHRALFSALLLLSLTGCAVYGGGYGHRDGHVYRHYDGYRYDYRSQPVYVVPRYQHERHRDYRPDARRYVPVPPPPRQHGQVRRHHDGYSRQERPRQDYRRHDQRAGQSIRRTWDAGRSVQPRYSPGRYSSGERRY